MVKNYNVTHVKTSFSSLLSILRERICLCVLLVGMLVDGLQTPKRARLTNTPRLDPTGANRTQGRLAMGALWKALAANCVYSATTNAGRTDHILRRASTGLVITVGSSSLESGSSSLWSDTALNSPDFMSRFKALYQNDLPSRMIYHRELNTWQVKAAHNPHTHLASSMYPQSPLRKG